MNDFDQSRQISQNRRGVCRPLLFRRHRIVAASLAAAALAWAASCLPGSKAKAPATDLDAEIVLDLAIAFHDPEGRWGSGSFAFTIEETRPDGTSQRSHLELANGERRFELQTERGGRRLALHVDGDEVSVLADGGAVVSGAEPEGLDLSAAQILRLRDHYLYLYGLPMKLRDPGTLLDPLARRTTFRGGDALELRVSYDPEVGSDRWTFLVDPLHYSLLAGRVEHAAEADDGEIIVFDGLVEVDGLRLPRTRRRTTNRDRRDLGTDTILVAGGQDG